MGTRRTSPVQDFTDTTVKDTQALEMDIQPYLPALVPDGPPVGMPSPCFLLCFKTKLRPFSSTPVSPPQTETALEARLQSPPSVLGLGASKRRPGTVCHVGTQQSGTAIPIVQMKKLRFWESW